MKDWGVAAGRGARAQGAHAHRRRRDADDAAIRAEAGPDADLIDVVSVMEKWADYDLDAGLGRTAS